MVDEAHVTNIAIDPHPQRRETGARLLLALLEWRARPRRRAATLEVRVGNRVAQRLYARFGFAPVGLRPGYYAPASRRGCRDHVDLRPGRPGLRAQAGGPARRARDRGGGVVERARPGHRDLLRRDRRRAGRGRAPRARKRHRLADRPAPALRRRGPGARRARAPGAAAADRSTTRWSRAAAPTRHRRGRRHRRPGARGCAAGRCRGREVARARARPAPDRRQPPRGPCLRDPAGVRAARAAAARADRAAVGTPASCCSAPTARSRRSAPRSTTPPARRSTRSPASSACPTPAGPRSMRWRRKGDPAAIAFPRAMATTAPSTSRFSGLKTAVVRELRRREALGQDIDFADVAASFQEAVVDVAVAKTMAAAAARDVGTVTLVGGVAANSRLRARMADACEAAGRRLLAPQPALCTDNGAMIAAAGYEPAAGGRAQQPRAGGRPQPAAGAAAAGSACRASGVTRDHHRLARRPGAAPRAARPPRIARCWSPTSGGIRQEGRRRASGPRATSSCWTRSTGGDHPASWSGRATSPSRCSTSARWARLWPRATRRRPAFGPVAGPGRLAGAGRRRADHRAPCSTPHRRAVPPPPARARAALHAGRPAAAARGGRPAGLPPGQPPRTCPRWPTWPAASTSRTRWARRSAAWRATPCTRAWPTASARAPAMSWSAPASRSPRSTCRCAARRRGAQIAGVYVQRAHRGQGIATHAVTAYRASSWPRASPS